MITNIVYNIVVGSTRKYVVDPSVAGGVPSFRGSTMPQVNNQPYSQSGSGSLSSIPTQPYSQTAAPLYNTSIPPQTYNHSAPATYSNMPTPSQPFNPGLPPITNQPSK